MHIIRNQQRLLIVYGPVKRQWCLRDNGYSIYLCFLVCKHAENLNFEFDIIRIQYAMDPFFCV